MGEPLKVGDRVRMTAAAKSRRQLRSVVGVVIKIEPHRWRRYRETPPGWTAGALVHRDGLARPTWHQLDAWERVPVNELTLDDTCQQLVAACRDGDTTAALALADRVHELLGGTKRE